MCVKESELHRLSSQRDSTSGRTCRIKTERVFNTFEVDNIIASVVPEPNKKLRIRNSCTQHIWEKWMCGVCPILYILGICHMCACMWAYMERIGATISSEAIRMPSSAMRPVSSSAHVGSPLVFPWPNTWNKTFKTLTCRNANHLLLVTVSYSNLLASQMLPNANVSSTTCWMFSYVFGNNKKQTMG